MAESTSDKKTASKKKAAAKQEMPADTGEILRMMAALQKDLAEIKQDPGLAAQVVSHTAKAQVTKEFILRVVAIANRNGCQSVSPFSFVSRVVKQYGLAAVDEAIRQSEDLCKSGSPEGMIVSAAKAYFDEHGIQDADYLDALAQEQEFLEGAARSRAPVPHEQFIAELVKPFSNLHYRSLSRLDYLMMVRNHCIDHPETYDFTRVLDYFEEIVNADPRVHALISGAEDVPYIPFDTLKRQELA